MESGPTLKPEPNSAEDQSRFSPAQRAIAAVAGAAVVGGCAVYRWQTEPSVEQQVSQELAETGDRAQALMQRRRLAQTQTEEPTEDPSVLASPTPTPSASPSVSPTPSPTETLPTEELLDYLPLQEPAPKRLIINQPIVIDFPIVYTDVDRGITNKAKDDKDNAPYNDPKNNNEFESMAMEGIDLDVGAKLGPLIEEFIETGQPVIPDEAIMIEFLVHRSSKDETAGGNGMVDNSDIDSATFGPGLQIGDNFKTRFIGNSGKELDLVWTIVQHPRVIVVEEDENGDPVKDSNGNVKRLRIGEPTDGSPSWLVEKDPKLFASYSRRMNQLVSGGQIQLPSDVKPIIENTVSLPMTSHKGNGDNPDDKIVDGVVDGSTNFASFMAVPTGVEAVTNQKDKHETNQQAALNWPERDEASVSQLASAAGATAVEEVWLDKEGHSRMLLPL